MVLYFYPAAMTFGCTKQACNYRDSMSELNALGVTVVGVSGDTPENLALFKMAYQLNYVLLSDVSGTISTMYGVPFGKGGQVKEKINDQEYELSREITTKRWTFVINPNGTIIYIDRNVNPMADAAHVLEIIKTNKSSQ
jgi:peroxiredoxin Q/BCP